MIRLLESEKDSLTPKQLEHLGSAMAFRTSEYVSLSFYRLPERDVRDALQGYNELAAVGAEEIWTKFPQERGIFVTQIKRPYSSDPHRVVTTHLRDCIFGDVLASENIHLPSTTQIGFSSGDFPDLISSLDISKQSLGRFEFLRTATSSAFSLPANYEFFCVKQYSTDLEPDVFQSLGLQLLSAHHVSSLRTVVSSRLSKSLAIARPGGLNITSDQVVPPDTSYIFLFDRDTSNNSDFNLALVNRILSAAALCGFPLGSILTCWGSSGESSFSIQTFGDQANSRNYAGYSSLDSVHIPKENVRHQECVTLIKRSNLQNFLKGKEDYRLRSLDTVEDSGKSGVPALTILQIWMAIECLVSVQQETTQSIALALSAFESAARRNEAFDILKSAYGFRSKVAHGYAFPRAEIYQQLDFVTPLFRRLFLSALKCDDADKFKASLREHVLSGTTAPFDSE